MKNMINSSLAAGILAGVLLLACASAKATAISITVDENGNATSTGNILSQGFMGVEEWTSSGNVLKYDTSSSTYAMAAGVVLIYDGSIGGTLSDEIVFFPDGVWYLEFMSFDHTGALADAPNSTFPVPPVNYTYLAQVSLTEGANGVTTYTPGSTGSIEDESDPGYISGYTTTYTFESDDPVPDGGATAGLLGMGLLGIAALKRKFAK